jgi:hypothetical protein
MIVMSKRPQKSVQIEEEEEPNKMYSFIIGGVIVIAIMVVFALLFH